MGCIYETHGFSEDSGLCMMWEEDGGMEVGADEKGFCMVSEDPDPGYGCQCYESDWCCHDCGADMNIEDCTCEDNE